MRPAILALLLLALALPVRAETVWAYSAEHDPYEGIMSHQAIGGGAQVDGDFAAIALFCEGDVLAIVMLDEAPYPVFGPTPIHYSFDDGEWTTGTWVHANRQATSFDEAAEFAKRILAHDKVNIRRGDGATREVTLTAAPPHVQRVLSACAAAAKVEK